MLSMIILSVKENQTVINFIPDATTGTDRIALTTTIHAREEARKS